MYEDVEDSALLDGDLELDLTDWKESEIKDFLEDLFFDPESE